MLGEKRLYTSNIELVVADTETEGLNLVYHRPWQLAWLCANKYKEHSFEDHFLLWDDLAVSKGAAAVTGFNMIEYLDKAKPPKEILQRFLEVIKNPNVWIVFHNLFNFDILIIQTACRTLGVEFHFSDFDYRFIDSLALARAYKDNITYTGKTNRDFFLWQQKILNSPTRPRGTGLSAMAKEFNIDIPGDRFHDAGYDIKVNLAVVLKLIKELKI